MKQIPESHLDLNDGSFTVVLSTVMPDGQPQVTPVWCNRRDGYILINVMKGFRKEKNMRANPNVSLLAYDPQNPLHNLEIRGRVVEMMEEGAVEHLDELTQLYLGKPDARFFGDSVSAHEVEPRRPSAASGRQAGDGGCWGLRVIVAHFER